MNTLNGYSKSTLTDKYVLTASGGHRPLADSEFIVGTQTAATGSWTGDTVDAELYDGKQISYWLPYNGSGNATLNLTLAGGSTTGAVNCYYGGTSRLTTHYGAGNIIRLVYRKNVNISGATYTGWWADANYVDGNTYTSAWCGTAAATAAKTATCSNYTLRANSYIHVLIRYTNTAASAITLNINSTGAKPIYINGVASSEDNYSLYSGTYIVFFNGTNYYFNTDGSLPGNIKDSSILWGTDSIRGDISPIDSAASYLHSGNKLLFADPKGITIEYSTNKGSTWIDYGTTNANKIGLVSGLYSAEYIIGKGLSTKALESDLLRITLHATNMGVYTRAKSLLIDLSTNGSASCKVKVETATKGNPSAFSTRGEYPVAGWSGWNRIPLNNITFGGSASLTSYIEIIRLTFTTTGTTKETGGHLRVLSLLLLGVTNWTTPSNMAKTGHLYRWDSSLNAIFPAQVTATLFNGPLNGNASSATKLVTKRKLWGQNFDGSADVSGDMTGVGKINTVFNLETQAGNASLFLETVTATTDYAHIFVNNKDDKNHTSRPLVLQHGYGSVGIGIPLPTQKLEVDGNVKATSFIGNLDGTYVNALTDYAIATTVGSISETDSLNTALGKLEFKTDFIYNDLFGTDNDEYINKWSEIVDFIDSVKEGTDILDEFVTTKTDLIITGQKNFNTNTNTAPLVLSRKGLNTQECVSIGVDDGTVVFNHIQDEKTANYTFKGTWLDKENSDGSKAGNHAVYFNLGNSDASIKLDTYTVYHTGNLTKLSQLENDSNFVTGGPYLPLAGGVMNDGAKITFNANGGIIQTTATTSNATRLVQWYKGASKDSDYTNAATIGWHNMGDTDGAIYLVPHPSNTEPWAGSVGLYIGKNTLKWNNNNLLHSGNSSVSGGGSTWGSSITVKINGTTKTLTIPAKPTDTKVTQTVTTSGNTSWRPIILGASYGATSSFTPSTVTDAVYASHLMQVKPDTGDLWIKGHITRSSGGSWIKARDNAVVKQICTASSTYLPVVSMKTASGSWSMGTLGNSEKLIVSYDTDENYNANTNSNTAIYFPTSGGTLALTSQIPNLTNYYTKTESDSRFYGATINRTANTVLAAPDGSAGVASFRKLVVADMPDGVFKHLGTENKASVWSWGTVSGTSGWNATASDRGYRGQYGTNLDISGFSTWYHRFAMCTDGRIEYWHGINTKTLTKLGTIAWTSDIPEIPNISITNSGSGNAVTSITASGHTLTVTKGSTFATSGHTHYYLTVPGDKRSEATTPSSYSNTFVFLGLKNNSAIDSPSSVTYSYLLGLRGWSDSSGGNSWELAFNNTGIYARNGASTWGSWGKIAFISDIPTKTSQLTNDSNFITSRGYIGTTPVLGSLAAQSLSGIVDIVATGNYTSAVNTSTSLYLKLANKDTAIGLRADSGTVRGVYDYGKSKWLVYSDGTDGTVLLGHVSTSSTWSKSSGGTGAGIKILNAIGSSPTGALSSYSIGLEVSGYYSLLLASKAGVDDTLYFKGALSTGWVEILHKNNGISYDLSIDTTITDLKQAGYGYATKGWKGSGPAIAIGSTNGYTTLIQQLAGNPTLYVSYKSNGGDVQAWNQIAFISDLTWANITGKPTIPTIPSLSLGNTTGSGNAVTSISVSGHTITLNKGTTFLTSHQSLANCLRSTAWVNNPGQDADTMTKNTMNFTYANNAPHTGPIIYFAGASWGSYGMLLNAAHYSGKSISFRTRNGDSGTWNPWYRLALAEEIPTKTSQLTNDSGFITSRGYIGTTSVQASSGNLALTGINNITTPSLGFTITTPSGNIQIGPQNTSGCHIYTNRDLFYFNKPIYYWDGSSSHVYISEYNYTSYTPILNSSSTHATKSSVIYAPTTSGNGGDILISDGLGSAPVWTSPGNITVGGAGKADKLTVARTIALSGAVTGSASFDGSANITIATSVNHTHNYLPLTGGTLTGSLTVGNKDANELISIAGNTSQLKMMAWTNATYIESGNSGFTDNVPLHITGYNANLGSTLYLDFNTITCRGSYTNIDSGNWSSYITIPTLYLRNICINNRDWTVYSPYNTNTDRIYAPTSAGTSGQVLVSTGGTPTWLTISTGGGGYIGTTAVQATSGNQAITGITGVYTNYSGTSYGLLVNNQNANVLVLSCGGGLYLGYTNTSGIYLGNVNSTTAHTYPLKNNTYYLGSSGSYWKEVTANVFRSYGGSSTWAAFYLNSSGTTVFENSSGAFYINSKGLISLKAATNLVVLGSGTAAFYPNTTLTLGTSSLRWNYVYATHLNAEGGSFYTDANGAYWTSDFRLKTNIIKARNLDVADLLVEFDWKESNEHSWGYIAQDLLEVLPEAVSYNADTDRYAVNYNVAHSAAIASLTARIKELEEKLKKYGIL